MKVRFTSEELVGVSNQPKETCPIFNQMIYDFQNSINTGNFNIINLKNMLNENMNSVSNILEWANEWKAEYKKTSSRVRGDHFTEAYILTAEDYIKKNSNFNLDKEKDSFFSKLDEFEDLFNSKKNDFVLNDTQKNGFSLLINLKKQKILESIEQFRYVAINNRNYGQYYKDAFKHNLLLEDKEIIQPFDLINEEQKNSKSFVLGVLEHEKTNKALLENEILNSVELVLFKKMDSNNKIDFLKNKLMNNYESISYYTNLEDFKLNKKYNTINLMKKEKIKLKKNITN